MDNNNTNIKFFKNQSELRLWFEKNHDKKTEQWIGFYKTNSGKANITWPQSVDEALCFGWIDGIRKSIDEKSYKIRFTPRKSRSIWSKVNINRVAELTKLGLMQPSGLHIFNKRDAEISNRYSFERESVILKEEYEKKFRKNKTAWNYFESLPVSYKKPAIWWVMSAKKEETQIKRLDILINDSEKGQKIPPLNIGTNREKSELKK
jgi:uncharacterized protein YdeI (YjbR/CyaY-like superfamily)